MWDEGPKRGVRPIPRTDYVGQKPLVKFECARARVGGHARQMVLSGFWDIEEHSNHPLYDWRW